jgi:toxin secretion/phage lysis holin
MMKAIREIINEYAQLAGGLVNPDSLKKILFDHPVVKTIGAFVSVFVSTDPVLFYILITLLLLDMLTGLMKASQTNSITSGRFVRGVFKMIGYTIAVGLIHLLTTVVPMLELGENIVIMLLSLTEAISIVENLGAIGVPIPKIFLRKLEAAKHILEQDEKTNA